MRKAADYIHNQVSINELDQALPKVQEKLFRNKLNRKALISWC